VHPPTSPYPALSAEAEKVIAGKDEIFMPGISGYIQERVNCPNYIQYPVTLSPGLVILKQSVVFDLLYLIRLSYN